MYKKIYLFRSTWTQIIDTRSLLKRKTWTDLLWFIGPNGPNLMILRGMFNFLRSSYDPKKYFEEDILNKKGREWEKWFHERNYLG